jgi:hypothetical protein
MNDPAGVIDTMILVTDLIALLFAFAAPAPPTPALPAECALRDHTTQEVVGYLSPCPRHASPGRLRVGAPLAPSSL